MDCRKIGFGIPGDLPELDGPKSIFRDECLRRIEDVLWTPVSAISSQ